MVNSNYKILVEQIKHHYVRSIRIKRKRNPMLQATLQKAAYNQYIGYKNDLERKLDSNFDWSNVNYPSSDLIADHEIHASYRMMRKHYIRSEVLYSNSYEAHKVLSEMIQELQGIDKSDPIAILSCKIRIQSYYDVAMQFSDEMTCHLLTKVYDRFVNMEA